jgi:hypothetical protein
LREEISDLLSGRCRNRQPVHSAPGGTCSPLR